MSHKVNPKTFRIKGIEDWDSRGFYGDNFPQYLEEDFKIREFLEKKIGTLGVENIETERSSGKITIIVSSARPGLIIGRGGEGIEKLKNEITEMLFSSKKTKANKKTLKLEIKEVKEPWASASLSAQWVVQQIEKRFPFRKVLKRAIDKIMMVKEVQGVRIDVSGRLGGAEIARREWLKKGRLPRQTIRANIDYALKEARCTYGTIGVKVWIYKGEKFE
ncbi:MAG: 30S ribosomal protein S3 [Candidatus Nealsonbacteria bacterium CG23_combo_of_CG06-09_8_20_14_all_39_17]|uniref:Small ribosomal subunit protein uS3 n=1 Tax=Candidatus Nealsonbacteria bacterium CG23_combo_of_CG06-09_8_20_14_all_39_17 TaxID=1974722 RepID=A0A2G9YTV1_9BACT|nr:MAG: 30S ribosomal protein S3 [Candidatus Nealsonbacteria bacterium CG23_combo_of_CG06-09_8_20_14_all_39_17]PIU43924.1 MAG: 30S ribosomal protein S3 [Candidatus Nealsonbacteria bacterium CG07_land_8_20_14_0_80_39_13]